jgi:TonB family protein
MSKALKRLMLAALAASLCVSPVAAQVPPAQSPADRADTWVVVSPAGEGFGVLMSKQPAASEQSVQVKYGLSASGRRYAAADGQTTFNVWSLKDPQEVGPRLLAADNSAEGVSGESLYLDRTAELAWELLVTPEFERLKQEGDTGERAARARVGMSYERQFKLGTRPAREYSIKLEKERGLVYVCAEDAHIYIVAGLTAAAVEPRLKLFADSFAIGHPAFPVAPTIQVDPALIKYDPRDFPHGLPGVTATATSSGTGSGGGTGTGSGTGIGPGRGVGIGSGVPAGNEGAPVDYSKPFKPSEVTKKALVTFKPEPGFTEWARRFNVTGVVRLRAVLHSSGTVQNISVVKSLPHGLTRKALDALKQVRFVPAQKDDRVVSQYAVFEYNFNIY